MTLISARDLGRTFPLPRRSMLERGGGQTALHPTDLDIEPGA